MVVILVVDARDIARGRLLEVEPDVLDLALEVAVAISNSRSGAATPSTASQPCDHKNRHVMRPTQQERLVREFPSGRSPTLSTLYGKEV